MDFTVTLNIRLGGTADAAHATELARLILAVPRVRAIIGAHGAAVYALPAQPVPPQPVPAITDTPTVINALRSGAVLFGNDNDGGAVLIEAYVPDRPVAIEAVRELLSRRVIAHKAGRGDYYVDLDVLRAQPR